MSALSRAASHLSNAVAELETAIEEAPAYSVRRITNARKVLGDVPDPVDRRV